MSRTFIVAALLQDSGAMVTELSGMQQLCLGWTPDPIVKLIVSITRSIWSMLDRIGAADNSGSNDKDDWLTNWQKVFDFTMERSESLCPPPSLDIKKVQDESHSCHKEKKSCELLEELATKGIEHGDEADDILVEKLVQAEVSKHTLAVQDGETRLDETVEEFFKCLLV